MPDPITVAEITDEQHQKVLAAAKFAGWARIALGFLESYPDARWLAPQLRDTLAEYDALMKVERC